MDLANEIAGQRGRIVRQLGAGDRRMIVAGRGHAIRSTHSARDGPGCGVSCIGLPLRPAERGYYPRLAGAGRGENATRVATLEMGRSMGEGSGPVAAP